MILLRVFQGVKSSNVAENILESGKNSSVEDIELMNNGRNDILINSRTNQMSASVEIRKRKGSSNPTNEALSTSQMESLEKHDSWRRILLLIIAITVHNIPGKDFQFSMHYFCLLYANISINLEM